MREGYVFMSVSPILPEERHRLIRQRLEADGKVLAIDLARELGTSEDTIRRDLRELAALGICQRVYGGALRRSPATGDLQARNRQNPEGKALVARHAADLARPGTVIFMDAGSTNRAIAACLQEGAGITVITNAPDIALLLLERGGFEVILVGGVMDARVGGTIGARAVRDIAAYAADLCFVGACAISAEAGVRCFMMEDAEFKQAMIGASRTVVLAATPEKIGTTAPFAVSGISAIDHLVVGTGVPADLLASIRDAGTTIHIAD